MDFDPKVPSLLKREQIWFGSIIGRPIDEDSKMNPLSPSGKPMEIEVAEHIVPSPTLRPAERIQIYNQQYWWRLLNAMHDLYPLVTRLFGYRDFNRLIAIPYLMQYPPHHWSLGTIGDRMVGWVREKYMEKDRQLVLEAASLDWAFSSSFTASEQFPLTTEDLPRIMESDQPLYLQPHVHLLEGDYDFFRYRVDFLKEDPDYWLQHDFPAIERNRPHYFVLYRNPENNISWRDCSKGEYSFLRLFTKGASINHTVHWLETQTDDICEEANRCLQVWFHQWTVSRWLSLSAP